MSKSPGDGAAALPASRRDVAVGAGPVGVRVEA